MRINKSNYKYIFIDVLLVALAFFLAFNLRFEANIPPYYVEMLIKYILLGVAIKIIAYILLGLYNIYWPSASTNEAFFLAILVLGTSLILLVFFYFYRYWPLSSVIMAGIIEVMLLGTARFIARYFEHRYTGVASKKNILIVGAGSAGIMLAGEIKNHKNVGRLVGFIDDDPSKYKTLVKGAKVLGSTKDIKEIIESRKVDELILAIPSASNKTRSDIINKVKDFNLSVKVVPSLYEIIDSKVTLANVREVSIDDLLGRDKIELDNSSLGDMIGNKVVLVTGGGGSIGSELCRQIANYNPKKLVILDIYENSAYSIQLELLKKHKDLDLEVCIESIREKERMEFIFDHYRPDIVFHAAAHKHVPLMEDSYISAIKNNVFGTRNLLNMADKYGVKRFVNISTDKAVNPTNIMGATKRIIEIMLQTINIHSKTEFVAVRFGNVLGSNGSVIPIFKKQIEEGGPVTVTHKDIIRYFMTIPEACGLVLQAGAIAKGGEIFILDMGQPVKILDLAENIIKLSGFEPYKDIDIKFTGLRPGEKLFEELILDLNNSSKTEFDKIYIEKPAIHDEELLAKTLDKLEVLVHGCEKEDMINTIHELVPEFNHKENK